MLTHRELCKRVSASLKSIHETWKQYKRVDPFLMTWPAGPVAADDGRRIDSPCILNLPADKTDWSKLMVQAISRTDAYAILVVEQRDKDVRALLESTKGTRCWTLPIARSGDVDRLGTPRVSINKECFGLLWSKARAKG